MKRFTSTRASLHLTLSVGLLMVCAIGARELIAERSEDSETTRNVALMISRYHISQKTIDDKISSQLFDKFVGDLDPQKLYFTSQDIDSQKPYRNNLDDLLKAGQVDFAYDLFALFLQRFDQRMELVKEQIAREHDFSIDETVVLDGKKLDWASTEEQLKERWRKRIKYELLLLKLDDKTPEESRETLTKRYRRLGDILHQTEEFETLEMYLSALTHCFDPHSSYMSPQSLEEFNIVMRLSLQGIGAQLRSEDGKTIVSRVMPGGAASKDGRLKTGDKIIAVAQDDGEWVDVNDMKLSKVVRYIRGKAGSLVKLKIETVDGGDPVVYDLVRQKIELNEDAVQGKIIEADKWIPGATGKVGVINIPSFYRDFGGASAGRENFRSTSRDVLTALGDFQDAGGVDAVVVDLRGNGGGALAEAIDVSGLFLGHGPVVQIKDLQGQVKSHDFDIEGLEEPVYTGPLVVLTNRGSASASEIFAGAIKDYGRGIVIGDTTTHGKGTVQNVVEVGRSLFGGAAQKQLGALKVTINQFYRVNGDSTQREGVKSDIVLPSQIDHMDLGEAFLDNALAFDHVDPAQHRKFDENSETVVKELIKSSSERINANDYFKKVQSQVEKYLTRKNREEVPLNEAILRKEREEMKLADMEDPDAAAVDPENPDEAEQGPQDPFKDTPYNKEIVHITLDYLKLLSSKETAGKN
ncbi:MAG TPA: carboxy terminal-processing peptidase [Planctomycetaceae bacterium]|nr:carboxy terminal-processing peptidase [Planctomycetaceae bacterium]